MRQTSVPIAQARLVEGLRIALGALLLMWPLGVAGRPTVYMDTGQYWWRGRAIIVQGLGLDPSAPNPFGKPIGAQVVIHGIAQDARLMASFMGARAATYSVLLFVTQQIGTLWLTAALQTLVTAAVFHAIWRAAAPKAAGWTYLAMMGALAACTSLAFYASFPMPDVFAGLGVLIVIALVLYWDRMGLWTRLGLWGVLALSLTFHNSNLLLTLLMLPLAWLVLRRLRAPWRDMAVRTAAVAAAIAVAGLGVVAADRAEATLTGVPMHNPPFLTARLLADGPGRTVLRRACAHATPFFLCRFKTLPLDNSEDILWSQQPDVGVFASSPVDDRLQLEAEQARFVRTVVLSDPLGVARSSMRNSIRQFGLFAVDEPLRDPCGLKHNWPWGQDFLRVLVLDPERCGRGEMRLMSPPLIFAAQLAAVILSIYALWRLARSRDTARTGKLFGELDDIDRLLAATSLTVAAIVLNAMICGALSGPFPRYEARLIWLVPTLVLLAGASLAEPSLARVRGSLSRTGPAKSAMG